MATTAAVPAAGYDTNGVYRSLRPAAPIPSDSSLSLNDRFFCRADACPSALALVGAATGRSLTFAALCSVILSTAVALASRAGVVPGDVVLLIAPNCLLCPVYVFAATALGAVASTANPLYTPREIAKQAADAHVKLLITVPELLLKVTGLGLSIILPDDPASATPSSSSVTLYSDLVSGVDETQYRRPPTKQDGTAALLYSSGTMGESKGVIDLLESSSSASSSPFWKSNSDVGSARPRRVRDV